MSNIKDLNEIRKILAESKDDSRTMGDVFIEELRGDLSIFTVRFESLINLLKRDREMSLLVKRWYDSGFDLVSVASTLIYSYRDLINIGEEPRSENKIDAFDKACRITEKYTEVVEMLAFLQGITEEICVVLPFINPSVYESNVYTQKCIIDFPQYKQQWEYLFAEITFFKNEALKVKPSKEIKHTKLTTLKTDKNEGVANLTDDDFIFPESMNFTPDDCYECDEEAYEEETTVVEFKKKVSIDDLQNHADREQDDEKDV